MAPATLALVRVAVALGGYAVVLVEALGAVGALRDRWVALGWSPVVVVVAVAVAVAVVRGVPSPRGRAADLLSRARALPLVDRLLVLTVTALASAELVIALTAVPNTWDSMAYHLPRIESWLAQGSLDVFATAEYRQAALAPGAELLLVGPRLLAGGPALYGLLQWGATLGCMLVVGRLAAQLGATTRGRLASVFVVATVPLVVLESTSTQVDMVAAFWAAATATLVLDGIRARAGWGTAALLGLATGLGVLTKSTVPLATAPLVLLWAVAQVRSHLQPGARRSGADDRRSGTGDRRSGTSALAGKAAVCLLLVAAVAGPFYARTTAEYGSPTGPTTVNKVHTTSRHDPPAVVMGVARAATGVLATPVPAVNATMQRGVGRLGSVLHVDPSDPRITIPGGRYGVPTYQRYDEDTAPFPVQAMILVVAGLLGLLGRRRSWLVRYYAATVVLAALLHATLLNYQLFLNRLLLTVVVLAAPLVGVCLAALPPAGERHRRAARAVALGLTALLGLTCAGTGVLALVTGRPRALVGPYSVFTHPPEEEMFALAPGRQQVYTWLADEVAATGSPRRVGTLLPGGAWEYPLRYQLDRRGVRAPLVALHTATPRTRPAAVSTVDVVVCLRRAATCRQAVPASWTATELVGAALPATVLRPPAPGG